MDCDRCATPYDLEDNYCRHCGQVLRTIEVSAVRRGPSLPAPAPVWRQAAPVVAQGAAMMAAGALLNLAGRRLARAAIRAPVRVLTRNGGKGNGASAIQRLPKGAQSFTEILYIRETRARR